MTETNSGTGIENGRTNESTEGAENADGNSAIYVPHQEFKTGLPHGRFRVIVNPERAQKYVKHRLFVVGISLPLLGVGVVLSMYGYLWVGLPMVVVGVLMHRVIKAHAPKILLHLALSDAKTYEEAMEYEILEVRRN
ncbi:MULTISPECIES: hypothetical protein [unclassified Polaromonas]|uniref:hypothetical protein n=1 Tax=unclassified Polaromonas TaxID=2638319 RepID=UPI000F097759|nr:MULTISPECIES: hypothetical protein [unclassified Polaromonas]AYQ26647.1 hypothetical protein DT070_00480 [Polaromonas sp. SP1]QGJ18509.1 hypothetical protein F7R28_08970 [Polaromonas sp. Pch-P]